MLKLFCACPLLFVFDKVKNIFVISIPYIIEYRNRDVNLIKCSENDTSLYIHLGFPTGLVKRKNNRIRYDLPELVFGDIVKDIIEQKEEITVSTSDGEYVLVHGEMIFKRKRHKKIMTRIPVYVFKKSPFPLVKGFNCVAAQSPEHAVIRIQRAIAEDVGLKEAA